MFQGDNAAMKRIFAPILRGEKGGKKGNRSQRRTVKRRHATIVYGHKTEKRRIGKGTCNSVESCYGNGSLKKGRKASWPRPKRSCPWHVGERGGRANLSETSTSCAAAIHHRRGGGRGKGERSSPRGFSVAISDRRSAPRQARAISARTKEKGGGRAGQVMVPSIFVK